MKFTIALAVICLLNSTNLTAQKNRITKGEIIYHVCQRSFFDSNGDKQGDLNGLRQKLGYLQDLGITSILLLPLYEADCYHNYFANDFEKIDPSFGTMQDYINLVKEIHQRGMKIYLDMETQYVAAKHLWWKDAVGNLQSPYSDYILFDDSAHTKPASIIADLQGLNGYDGKYIRITTVNLKSKKVLEYNKKLFGYFVDPNQDGKFDDGVDGFRLDHTMDNLDGKPSLTHLFESFWTPLLTYLKTINPKLKNVAEQADWKDYGYSYFKNAGVDRMFGFGLQQAILSFDKKNLIRNADSILAKCPEGKEQIIFIENHDLDRFASLEKNPAKQRVAALEMILIGGIPSIYYGQEIGMLGKSVSFDNSDGNDIPRREAFEWYKTVEGQGMALWYKNIDKWWSHSNLKSGDGISVEEEKLDSNSLYQYYKKLIQVKQSNQALTHGKYALAENDNEQVFSWYRVFHDKKCLIVANLSNQVQKANLAQASDKNKLIFGNGKLRNQSLELQGYQVAVFEIN